MIPEALLEMFQVGTYIPMSMFLVENMELICLDQGVKTHKGHGVQVIELANFVMRSPLISLCMLKLITISLMHGDVHAARFATPLAWDVHFLGASQDPQFTADWKCSLYDIV